MSKRRIKTLTRYPALERAGAETADPGGVAIIRHGLEIIGECRAIQGRQKAKNRCAAGNCGQNSAPWQMALRQINLRPTPTQAPTRHSANLRRYAWHLAHHALPSGQTNACRSHVKRPGDATRHDPAYIAPMTLIRAALFAPLSLCLGLSAGAEEVSLDRISSYINSLKSAEAQFVQTNADGSIAKGRIVLQRPGRARFEYDPPDKNLVLASGNMVAIFDAKSNQPPEQYPLARTPLNLILAAKVDFSTAKMVVDHREFEGATHVLAQDPKHPDYGTIELIFNEDPVALTEWVITDDIGNQTSVKLDKLKPAADYPASLFSIDLETRRRMTH